MHSTLSTDSFFRNDYDNHFEHDIHNIFQEKTSYLSESKRKYYHDYWEILHIIGYLYPEQPSHSDKTQIHLLFNYISNGGLPCSSCVIHFNEYMNQRDLYHICKNRHNLKNFIIDLHNHVNKRTGKDTMDYSIVDEMYSNISERCDRILSEKQIDIRDRLNNYEVYTFIDDLK